MPNFEFLKEIPDYAWFTPAALEAERAYASSPALCAMRCRVALERAVQWVYAADESIQAPYKHSLQALVHEDTFRDLVPPFTWEKLLYIIKLGNLAVGTNRTIHAGSALTALRGLFEFIHWIDYSYGTSYQERTFEEARIPSERVTLEPGQIKVQKNLIREYEERSEFLRDLDKSAYGYIQPGRKRHTRTQHFTGENISEFETRKKYIDLDLALMGWNLSGPDADVRVEYEVEGMAGVPGQLGYADYVLFGKDGVPLAVVEAKSTSKDPNIGRQQASLYADCLERKFGRRPMMFTTNGFETYFWDDRSGPQRKVSLIFSKDDLQKLMNRRSARTDLTGIPISDKITDRYYQKEAIRAVCERIQAKRRKHLLVMATGTGKTRTASSLTDVLSRGGYVTNILFLADRISLVKQAKDDFRNYLPDMSLCNLCGNKDDRNARIVFSTYPTMLNAIDAAKTEDGKRLFTPAHFDLIVIDESHRSIFKKYRAIFDYFDALMVGLTATPKTEVDRNTYDFFEMETGVPTYAYDYKTAVEQDHVLVPYFNYEVKTKFLEEGIKYEDLSPEDKKRYEEDFLEGDDLPSFIPSEKLNKFIFNEKTVDVVLQDLMKNGIHIAGGEKLGKTIIFAQNKRHAEFILNRFNALYPEYKGLFAQRVICDDSYAQSIIENFKKPDQNPFIAVSVDMMDTGIDVPECVNLVFFKKVHSKTKFWQMIGRGTRLCKGLICTDSIDGEEYYDKKRFLIFDYCGNFEYFRAHSSKNGTNLIPSISEKIFSKQVRLIEMLQESTYADSAYQAWRAELVSACLSRISELNINLTSVLSHRQSIERFKKKDAFTCLSPGARDELTEKIAPLVHFADPDEFAKRFDNFMYGLCISAMLKPSVEFILAEKRLRKIGQLLERKISIPQVREKLQIIQRLQMEEFWKDGNILAFEDVRRELRDLLKFLEDDASSKKTIVTSLQDPVIESREGRPFDAEYDFKNYRERVDKYINEHADTQAIFRLTHNIPLEKADYQELERIFTSELGGKEDYEREFGETPFGLLVRKIAKLDHEAAMAAFSRFINDQALNARQIAFVEKIINHIERNGYMEDTNALYDPPFNYPQSFLKLFTPKQRSEILSTIEAVRANALYTDPAA